MERYMQSTMGEPERRSKRPLSSATDTRLSDHFGFPCPLIHRRLVSFGDTGATPRAPSHRKIQPTKYALYRSATNTGFIGTAVATMLPLIGPELLRGLRGTSHLGSFTLSRRPVEDNPLVASSDSHHLQWSRSYFPTVQIGLSAPVSLSVVGLRNHARLQIPSG